ncbi:MAG: DUF47 domain-containing protein [candidate division KSB1 bacterium]|nr:DUF47 domain-containing protein [candidate division KSB1 bacterium]
MLKIISREEKFYDMFNEAAQNIYQGAQLLNEMMEDSQNLERLSQQIKALEDKGDEITHNIVTKLNQTFITPFDCEDIHALACRLDDVMDFIEAAADRFVMFKLERPTETAKQLAEIILHSAEEIKKGVAELKNMGSLYKHYVELNRLENEADAVFRQGLRTLFQVEQDPVTIMKLKEIYEDLEGATDRCEDVANILEAIVVKSQ